MPSEKAGSPGALVDSTVVLSLFLLLSVIIVVIIIFLTVVPYLLLPISFSETKGSAQLRLKNTSLYSFLNQLNISK